MEDSLRIGILTTDQVFHVKKKLILEIFGSVWVAIKVGLTLLAFSGVVLAARQYHSNLPIPVKMKMTADKLTTANQEFVQLTQALEYLKCPQSKIASIAEGILKGAKTIGVDPKLILALLFTESRFNLKAISSKGFQGLMQTPSASKEYADVDILYGCRILQEKMNSTRVNDGKLNMRKALAMYKGGLNPMAYSYADETLALYKRLQTLGGN
jgi:soluble lytic murein transglycosylase-like protein